MGPDLLTIRRVAAEALRTEATTRKWYRDPESIKPLARASLERAARQLGAPLPSRPSTPPTPSSGGGEAA